jgi:NAD(P)H-hydrate epimerase
LIARGIGIPSEAEQELPYSVLEAAALNTFVPARPLDAHKYRFGRVLVIAGSDHFLGAPVLCAGGAVRVGAGLVTVASTRDVRLNVAAHQPEVTFTQQDIVIEADPVGAVRALEPYLRSHRSVVLGPGLGRGHATTQFVAELLERRPKEHHLVIDADGLFALAEIPDWQRLVDANVVLTPHAGELERLVGHELGTERAAWEEAGALAKAWGCVLVAKGPFTSVAGPDGRVQVWPHANPALATGGTGDVLAGICGSLLAQGCQTVDGACLAVGVHALAAERIVSQRQWRTLVASDLFSELPAVLGELGASRPSDAR